MPRYFHVTGGDPLKFREAIAFRVLRCAAAACRNRCTSGAFEQRIVIKKPISSLRKLKCAKRGIRIVINLSRENNRRRSVIGKKCVAVRCLIGRPKLFQRRCIYSRRDRDATLSIIYIVISHIYLCWDIFTCTDNYPFLLSRLRVRIVFTYYAFT